MQSCKMPGYQPQIVLMLHALHVVVGYATRTGPSKWIVFCDLCSTVNFIAARPRLAAAGGQAVAADAATAANSDRSTVSPVMLRMTKTAIALMQ